MPRRVNLLNVRDHLEHLKLILTQLKVDIKENGGQIQPVLEWEIRRAHLINTAILDKHYKSRSAGNRKDLRINE